ncbi:DoxX family protein [Chitinophaga caeni]|uniref:DoxX family protein n=1 Tax=Chitinophaga caeni TaxID=2029983 RepID=A0A291QWF5_9BACT|nr:DoxX family membrane protein [Chitinophaga caeni]ATL48260.1 DoxX family protein [Chitinophaga caeni]
MKTKILFVLCLLTGIMFINAGLDKFFHYMPLPADMPEKMVKAGMAFLEIGWLLPLIATFEIVGGVLLIFKRTRALGAIVLFPILCGILLSNITTAPSGLPIALVITAIILWAMFDNKDKYLPLIRT